MITTGTLQLPYYVIRLEEHHSIKESLLKLIDEDKGTSISDSHQEIRKSDFFLQKKEKKYLPIIMPVIWQALKQLPVSFDNYTIDEKYVWYQQYTRFNHHCFHTHDSPWAIVYYLELDKGSPGTQFKNYTTSEIFNPQVTEGDLLVFPGWIEHRSPPNLSSNRKTVIACNVTKDTK